MSQWNLDHPATCACSQCSHAEFMAEFAPRAAQLKAEMQMRKRSASAPNNPPPRAAVTEYVRLHGVTWLLLRDGCVLLERCPKKARVLGAGEWFVPGGKIEDDETPEAACRREIGEEWPGVELLTLTPLPIVEGSPVLPGPRGAFLMRPYVITVRGDVPTVAANGVPLRWVPVAEALASPVSQVRMMVAAADRVAHTPSAPADPVLRSARRIATIVYDDEAETIHVERHGAPADDTERERVDALMDRARREVQPRVEREMEGERIDAAVMQTVLRAPSAPIDDATRAEVERLHALLAWTEERLGLHTHVDLLYVVDGYTVTLWTENDDEAEVLGFAPTLIEALANAQLAWNARA